MIPYLILAALVFGVCFLVDKGFSKVFRNRKEHRSGLAVKQNKRAALFGLVLGVLGIAGILAGLAANPGILILSVVVLLMAAFLVANYLSFGIYYDDDTFLVASFGKKSQVYSYGDIRAQKLYVIQGGSVLVELHMNGGAVVSVQTTMDGAFPFLDHAFARWCRQKGLDAGDCPFHDPGRYQWFPEEEAA